MADRYIWWLGFFDDWLIYILLSQEKIGHLFFGLLQHIKLFPKPVIPAITTGFLSVLKPDVS